MNFIILPPTPEEIAEHERLQKELWDAFELELEECIRKEFVRVGLIKEDQVEK